MSTPQEQLVRALMQSQQTVTEAKRDEVVRIAAEKKALLDPNFEVFDPDMYEVTDNDSLLHKRTGEEIRVKSNRAGQSLDAFEVNPKTYLSNPKRFEHHKQAYAKLYGVKPEDVSMEDLNNLGQIQKQRLTDKLENLRGTGLRRQGQDMYGRSLAMFDNEQPFEDALGLDGNAAYFAPSNYARRASDIVSGEYGDMVRGRGKRSWGDFFTDQPINVGFGAGRMANELAQSASVIARVNTEGTDEFFSNNTERLENFKNKFLSPQQLARERDDKKRSALNPELFELRKNKAIAEGKSETRAEISAGVDEFLDRFEYLMDNPGRIMDASMESLPYLLGAAGVGRAALKRGAEGIEKKTLDKLMEASAKTGVAENPAIIAQVAKAYINSDAGRKEIGKYAANAVAGAVGITEGLSAGADVYSSIVSMTPEEAMQSEQYRALINSGKTHRQAVVALAEGAFVQTVATVTVVAGLAGKLTGAAAFESKLFSGLADIRKKAAAAKGTVTKQTKKRGLVKGAIVGGATLAGKGAFHVSKPGAKEALEESIQSGGGEFLSQLASFDATGEPVGPGVGAATAEGVVVGFASGAGASTLSDGTKKLLRTPLEALRNSAGASSVAPKGFNIVKGAVPSAPVNPNNPNNPPGSAPTTPIQPIADQQSSSTYNPSEALIQGIETVTTRLQEGNKTISIDEFEAMAAHVEYMENNGIAISKESKEAFGIVNSFYESSLAQQTSAIADRLANAPADSITSDEIAIINRAAARNVIPESVKSKLPENVQETLKHIDTVNSLIDKLNKEEDTAAESEVTDQSQRRINSAYNEKMGNTTDKDGNPGLGMLRNQLENIMADTNRTKSDKDFIKWSGKFREFLANQEKKLENFRRVVKNKADYKNEAEGVNIFYTPQVDGKGGTKGMLDTLEKEYADILAVRNALALQYGAWTGQSNPAVRQEIDNGATSGTATPKSATKVATTTQKDTNTGSKGAPNKTKLVGENIASPFRGRNTTPLAAALTNVTFGQYPVDNVPGLKKPDPAGQHKMSAEAWYQANKTGDQVQDIAMMQQVIEAKFKQYPQLVEQVKAKGGRAWIEASEHTVNGNARWEGQGMKSNFLRVLASAYDAVTSKPAESAAAKKAPVIVEESAEAAPVAPTQAEPESSAEAQAEARLKREDDEIDPNAPIVLNEGQRSAFDAAMDFMKSRLHSFAIIGSAGTGKTTLVNSILDKLDNKYKNNVVLTSPTHRANAVTRSKGPAQPVLTLHALLGLKPTIDLDNYDASKLNFDRSEDAEPVKMPPGGLIIVDESSMINDDLYDEIMRASRIADTKVIFLGDLAQLGPIHQLRDSKSLSHTDGSAKLTQVMRAKNPMLLDESVIVRKGGDFSNRNSMDENDNGVRFTKSAKKFIDRAVQMFSSKEFVENPLLIRVLSYTNAGVDAYNRAIRKKLYGENAGPFVEGELLMGYNAHGKKSEDSGLHTVSNGIDYIVRAVGETTHEIMLGTGVDVISITIQDVYNLDSPKTMRIVSPDTPVEVIRELAEEATRMIAEAKRPQVKEDRENNIVGETDAQYSTRKSEAWARFHKATKKYPLPFDLINTDSTKYKPPLALRKVLAYGYSHTIHKSQGGTYKYVMVDANTINSSQSEKQKGRLRYVALTRAEHGAFVLTQARISNAAAPVSLNAQESQAAVSSEKNIFTVEPIQSVDKKAKSKAKIATQYIGFAEGIAGSTTALYAEQAGQYANTGNYSSSDTIFVSIGGKRGDATIRKQQQDKTIKEAVKALEAGATLITDNAAYVESNAYNEGEKRLAAHLKDNDYAYSEITVDGNLLGVWVKVQPKVEAEAETNFDSEQDAEADAFSEFDIEDFGNSEQGETLQVNEGIDVPVNAAVNSNLDIRLDDALSLQQYIANSESAQDFNKADIILVNPSDNAMLAQLMETNSASEAIIAVINHIQPDPSLRVVQLKSSLDPALQEEATNRAKDLNTKGKTKAIPMSVRWQNFVEDTAENINRWRGSWVAGQLTDERLVLDRVKKALKDLGIPTSLDKAFKQRSKNTASLISSIPNVMEVLNDTAGRRKLAKELGLSPAEAKALASFSAFYKMFKKTFDENRRQLILTKDIQMRETTIHFFENLNNEVEPNVMAAMALEAMLHVVTTGPHTLFNDDDAINAIFGREVGIPSQSEKEVLTNAGTLRNLVVNDLGKSILRHLNLEKLAPLDHDSLFAQRVSITLGGYALSTLALMGRVELTAVSQSWFMEHKTGKADPKLTDSKLFTNFVRNAVHDTNGPNHRRYDDVNTSLRESVSGGMEVFERLFGVDNDVKTPSFKKPTKVNTTVDRSLASVPEEVREMLLNNSQRAWTPNMSLMELVQRFDRTQFLSMLHGYVNDSALEQEHITEVEATKGRNRGLVRDYDAAVNWTNQHSNRPFYLLMRMIRSGRFYINSNTINPQANKLHRYMFSMSDWRFAVSTAPKNKLNSKELAAYESFIISIGLGLGVKTDNLSHKEIVQRTEAILKSPEMQAALDVLNKEGKIESSQDMEILGHFLHHENGKLGKPGGEGTHTLAALNAWREYKNAPANSTITSTLPMEVDGITNGFIATLLQLPPEVITEDFLDMLRAGGIYFKGDDIKNHPEYVAAKRKDNYQQIAQRVNAVLKSMADGTFEVELEEDHGDIEERAKQLIRKRASEIYSSGLLPSLTELVESIGRKWSKDPLIVTAYGASLKAVVNAIVNNALVDFHKKLAKAALVNGSGVDITTEIANINIATEIARVMNSAYIIANVAMESVKTANAFDSKGEVIHTGQQPYNFTADNVIKIANAKFNGSLQEMAHNFKLEGVPLHLFTQGIEATYGVAITTALEEKLGPIAKLRDTLNHANKLMNIVFVKDFVRRMELRQKLSGTILGDAERRQIMEDMWREGMVPSVSTALSKSRLENLESINSTREIINHAKANARSHFETDVDIISRAFVGPDAVLDENASKRGSLTHNILAVMVDTDVGVAAVVRLIHSTDGANNMEAWGKNAVLNLHDAVIGNANDIDRLGKNNNQKHFEMHRDYNLPEAILEATLRVLAIMNPNDNRLSEADKKSVREDFIAHMLFRKVPGVKEALESEVSAKIIVFDFVNDLRDRVAASTFGKQALFSQIIYDNQFGKDGTEYQIEGNTEIVRNSDISNSSISVQQLVHNFSNELRANEKALQEIEIKDLVNNLLDPTANFNKALIEYIDRKEVMQAKELVYVLQAVYNRAYKDSKEVTNDRAAAASNLVTLNSILSFYIEGTTVVVGDIVATEGGSSIYDPNTNRITIGRHSAHPAADIMHEAIHAANISRLQELEVKNPDELERLTKLASDWANSEYKPNGPFITAATTIKTFLKKGNKPYAISEYLAYTLTEPKGKYELAFASYEGTPADARIPLNTLLSTLYDSLKDPVTGNVVLRSNGTKTTRELFNETYTLLEPDKVQQIFNDLTALEQGPIDLEHQQTLSTLIRDVIVPGLKSMNQSFVQYVAVNSDSAMHIGELDGNSIFLESAGNKLSSNVEMSLQEVAVHEYVHAISEDAVNKDPEIRKELKRLFELAKKSITVDDFIPANIVGDPAIARELAQLRYDYIFNNPKQQHYHEFLAIGLTNKAFATALSKIDNVDATIATGKLDWGSGILKTMWELFLKAVHRLGGVSVRDTRGNVSDGLQNLAKSIVAINQLKMEQINQLTNTDKFYNAVETGNSAVSAVAEKLVSKLSSAMGGGGRATINKANPTLVGAVRSAIGSAVAAKDVEVRKAYNEVYRAMGGRKDNIFFHLIDEITAWKDENLNWIDMLGKSKRVIDQARQSIIQHTKDYLVNAMSKNNYLNEDIKESVTRVMLNTDLSSLMQGDNALTYQEVADLLNGIVTNTDRVGALRRQYEDELKQELARQNAPSLFNVFDNQTSGLSDVMINGEVLLHHQMLNAHNIVNQFNLPDADKISLTDYAPARQLVDKITTLKALQRTPVSDVSMALHMINHEVQRTDVPIDENGFSRILGQQLNFQSVAIEALFDGISVAMIKGYTYEIFDETVNLEFVEDTPQNRIEKEKEGMELVGVLPKDEHDPTKEIKLIYRGYKGIANYNKAALSLSSTHKRGTNLHQVSNYSGRATQRNLKTVRNKGFMAAKGQFSPGRVDKHARMVPVLNNEGEIVDYRYLMTERNKRKLLKKRDAYDQVLPRMFGSVTDRVASKMINREIARMLWEEYQALKDSREHLFIEIGKKTFKRDRSGNALRGDDGALIGDASAQEMYNLLPSDMRRELQKTFGGEAFYIRDDLMNLVLGYRKMSAVNGIKWGKATPIVRMADTVWLEIVRFARIKIATQTPDVVIGNFASNTAILLAQNIKPDYIRKKTAEAISAMRAYQKDLRRRDELVLLIGEKKAFKKNTSALEAELGRIKADLVLNPVATLVDAGLFTSITQDLGEDENTPSQKLINKATDKLKGKVPDLAVTLVKELYMLPGSKGYHAAIAATQYSDFTARYVKYHHDTQVKGKDPKESLRDALATFIYYDIPQNKYLQASNDYGTVMFTKFFLRIQPIVARLYSQNPVSAFGVLALQHMLMPRMLNENIIEFGFGSGLTSKPTLPWNVPGKMWETLDPRQPASLDWLLGPFGGS